MKTSGIYKIVNKLNGRYYVGSSKDILTPNKGRWYEHKRSLSANKHKNSHLQRAWNKYGEKNFKFVIVEKCVPDVKTLLEREQVYLNLAKIKKRECYNMSFIAGAVDFTPEIRRKMSNARMGRYIGEKSPDFIYVDDKTTNKLKSVWIKLGKYGLLNYAKSNCGLGAAPIRRLIKLYRKDPIAVKHRKKYYCKLVKKYAKINGEKIRGTQHPCADNTIYKFFNLETKKIFIGDRYDFNKLYKLGRGTMHNLVKGKIRKTHSEWTIMT
jgi:group I intron endonuclease